MSDTLGQLLREAREARGETLDDVERVTHSRAPVDRHQTDDFGALPSPAQARVHQNYAQHLGLTYRMCWNPSRLRSPKRPAAASSLGAARPAPRSPPDQTTTARGPASRSDCRRRDRHNDALARFGVRPRGSGAGTQFPGAATQPCRAHTAGAGAPPAPAVSADVLVATVIRCCWCAAVVGRVAPGRRPVGGHGHAGQFARSGNRPANA